MPTPKFFVFFIFICLVPGSANAGWLDIAKEKYKKLEQKTKEVSKDVYEKVKEGVGDSDKENNDSNTGPKSQTKQSTPKKGNTQVAKLPVTEEELLHCLELETRYRNNNCSVQNEDGVCKPTKETLMAQCGAYVQGTGRFMFVRLFHYDKCVRLITDYRQNNCVSNPEHLLCKNRRNRIKGVCKTDPFASPTERRNTQLAKKSIENAKEAMANFPLEGNYQLVIEGNGVKRSAICTITRKLTVIYSITCNVDGRKIKANGRKYPAYLQVIWAGGRFDSLPALAFNYEVDSAFKTDTGGYALIAEKGNFRSQLRRLGDLSKKVTSDDKFAANVAQKTENNTRDNTEVTEKLQAFPNAIVVSLATSDRPKRLLRLTESDFSMKDMEDIRIQVGQNLPSIHPKKALSAIKKNFGVVVKNKAKFNDVFGNESADIIKIEPLADYLDKIEAPTQKIANVEPVDSKTSAAKSTSHTTEPQSSATSKQVPSLPPVSDDVAKLDTGKSSKGQSETASDSLPIAASTSQQSPTQKTANVEPAESPTPVQTSSYSAEINSIFEQDANSVVLITYIGSGVPYAVAYISEEFLPKSNIKAIRKAIKKIKSDWQGKTLRYSEPKAVRGLLGGQGILVKGKEEFDYVFGPILQTGVLKGSKIHATKIELALSALSAPPSVSPAPMAFLEPPPPPPPPAWSTPATPSSFVNAGIDTIFKQDPNSVVLITTAKNHIPKDIHYFSDKDLPPSDIEALKTAFKGMTNHWMGGVTRALSTNPGYAYTGGRGALVMGKKQFDELYGPILQSDTITRNPLHARKIYVGLSGSPAPLLPSVYSSLPDNSHNSAVINSIFEQDLDSDLILSKSYVPQRIYSLRPPDGKIKSPLEFRKIENRFRVYIFHAKKESITRAVNLGEGVLVRGKKQYDEIFGDTPQNWISIRAVDSEATNVPPVEYPQVVGVEQFNYAKAAGRYKLDPACPPGQNKWPKIPTSEEKIKEIITAAQKGDADAQWVLGSLFEDGRFGEINDHSRQQAVRWYESAARKCNQFAENSLGAYHYYGNGVYPPNGGKAQSYFLKSAAQGNAMARVNLGLMQYKGAPGMASSGIHSLGWLHDALQQARQQGDQLIAKKAEKAIQDIARLRKKEYQAKKRQDSGQPQCDSFYGFSCNGGVDMLGLSIYMNIK